MVYKIRNWDSHFENSASRKLKRLEWVPLPNRTDGEGYTALVDHPNGAAHFGAWVAIVEVASKSTPRGYLPIGVNGGLCRSLCRMTRLSEKVFEEAIPRLVQIGWIEEVQSNQQSATNLPLSATTSADSPDTSADCGTTGKGMEGKGSERHGTVEIVVRSHAEFPEMARAVRESYPATDDIFVMKLASAVHQKILSSTIPVIGEATDEIMAEAVRDCRKNSPKQNGPGLFERTVPQCVATWLTQGRGPMKTVVPFSDRGMKALELSAAINRRLANGK